MDHDGRGSSLQCAVDRPRSGHWRLDPLPGFATTYSHNATDARVSKTTGTTTTYYPSGDYSVKGSTTTVHIGSYATVDTTSGVSTTRTNHVDHLGSTSIVTDSSGVMVQLLDYYPYGSERLHTGTADEQKTYIGEYSDDESGLSYLNARYYDPQRGQFLGQDFVFLNLGIGGKETTSILMDPQTLNSYLYARGNPIGFVDPQGTAPAIPASNYAPSYWECLQMSGLNPLNALIMYMTYQGMAHDIETVTDPAQSWSSRLLAGLSLGLSFTPEGSIERTSVWGINVFARGRFLETVFGANLGWNFPVIDKFMNGVATSIKSINLNTKSYQNMGTLSSKLKGYIDEVAGFIGKSWGDDIVKESEIQSRELQVVIPEGSLTDDMSQVFQEITDYANNLGVDFKYIEF